MISFKELKRNLKHDLTEYPQVKVSLVGDTATQFLATAIKGMGVERGYNIDLFEAEYSQVERQFMDPTSDLYEFDADYIIIFQSTHKWGEHHSSLNQEQQANLADDRISFLTSICENPALANKNLFSAKYFVSSIRSIANLSNNEQQMEYVDNYFNDGFTYRIDGSIYYDKKYRNRAQSDVDKDAATWMHNSFKNFNAISVKKKKCLLV